MSRSWYLAHDADAVGRALAGHPPEVVLWVGEAPAPFQGCRRSDVRKRLGQAFEAVVLDLRADLDADVLGQAQGFIWGGGALVLLVGEPVPSPRFAVHPYRVEDVGTRLYRRLLRVAGAALLPAHIPRASHRPHGTAEQAAVAADLSRILAAETPTCAVLLADRGRGKSAALGLAAAGLDGVVVTAARPEASAEVCRFAPQVPYVSPTDLAFGRERPRAILIDEAAQLPVPLLRRVAEQHPQAHLLFATTARGYEGTGRGFVLRFLAWLEQQPRPVHHLTLRAPIRWSADDPLERMVFDALLLDARPAEGVEAERVEHRVLDRSTVDEPTLRQAFGLLIHAHYRTTPGDLHRILDAPNLRLHALMSGSDVVAVTLLALEGGFDAAQTEALRTGVTRARGHALPETLICHAAHPEAGALRWVRSVRIATHPALRRRGLAARLVDAVHAHYQPDAFGTLFGATPELLRFRRAVGYELVRVGISAGARTGEPAAVMMRPCSEAARRLLTQLRAELARDLPTQLSLMTADNELYLDPRLEPALLANLPAPAPLLDETIEEAVQAYLFGPRPWEASAYPIRAWVLAHQGALAGLPAVDQALIRGRVIERRGWAWVTRNAALPSLPAAMRALRRAMRALHDLVEAPR